MSLLLLFGAPTGSRQVICTPEVLLLTEQVATINRSRKVVCTSESILLTENTAIIERTVFTFKPHVMMHHMQIAGGLMG